MLTFYLQKNGESTPESYADPVTVFGTIVEGGTTYVGRSDEAKYFSGQIADVRIYDAAFE